MLLARLPATVAHTGVETAFVALIYHSQLALYPRVNQHVLVQKKERNGDRAEAA